MKNCEPPELGAPVLAMERVPEVTEEDALQVWIHIYTHKHTLDRLYEFPPNRTHTRNALRSEFAGQRSQRRIATGE